MSQEGPRAGYNAVSRFNHWLIAAVAIFMLTVGLYAGEVPREERGFWMGMHISVGTTALLFVLFRIGWRLRGGFPPLPAGPVVLNGLARLTHWLMLLALLVMIVTGPLSVFSGGRDIGVFGLFSIPTFMERHESLHHLLEDIHGVTGKVLIGLIVLHLLGTIYHVLVSRDGTATRMLRGSGGDDR